MASLPPSSNIYLPPPPPPGGTQAVQRPGSVLALRALLPFQAGLALLGTLEILGTFYRVAGDGTAFNPVLAVVAVLLGVGVTVGYTGSWSMLGRGSRGAWWLALGVQLLAFAKDVELIVAIPNPDKYIGVGLVLDVYLVNGLMALVALVLIVMPGTRRWTAGPTAVSVGSP